jgi:hypothetical protein
VFNFYRPGYVPPNTLAGKAGLHVPEMQITHETTVAGYANFMLQGLQDGFGQRGGSGRTRRPDVQVDYGSELAWAANSDVLVDGVWVRLTGALPAAALKSEIVAAVDSIAIPALRSDGGNRAAVDAAQRKRVYTAVYLALVAPEFLVQK